MSNSRGNGRDNSSRTSAAEAGRHRCQGSGLRRPTPLTAAFRAGKVDILRMSLVHSRANMRVRPIRYESAPPFRISIKDYKETTNLLDLYGYIVLHLSLLTSSHSARRLLFIQSGRANKAA